MTLQITEFNYSKGDKITELIKPEYINEIREKYANNCVGLAENLSYMLFNEGMLASAMTFKNGNAFLDGGIQVWSDLEQYYKLYTHHTVILLGNCIMDILHSDDLIETSKYVKMLKEKNPKLRLDYTMTHQWYDSKGYPTQITLKKLETGNW